MGDDGHVMLRDPAGVWRRLNGTGREGFTGITCDEGRAGSRDRRPATDELGQRPLRHTDSLSPTTDNPSGALPAAGCPQGGGGGGAFVGSVGQTGPQD